MNWDYGDQEFNGPKGYVDVVSEKAVGPVTKAPAEAYKPVRRSPSSYLGWGSTNRNHIRKGVSSYHKGIVIHALCDASTLNVSTDVDPQIYMFMTTANGGDPSERPL